MADNTMFSASGGGLVSSQLSGTFANKPLPSAVPVGTGYFATDGGISGSLWRSNGTAWKAVGKSIPLLSYVNDAGFTAIPSSAEQVATSEFFIPGGLIEPGDKLQWGVHSEDVAANDALGRALRLRARTVPGILSGIVFNSIANTGASQQRLGVDKSVVIQTGSSKFQPSIASAGFNSTAFTAGIIDWSVNQYIGGTIQNAGTLANHLLYFMHLEVIKGS